MRTHTNCDAAVVLKFIIRVWERRNGLRKIETAELARSEIGLGEICRGEIGIGEISRYYLLSYVPVLYGGPTINGEGFRMLVSDTKTIGRLLGAVRCDFSV